MEFLAGFLWRIRSKGTGCGGQRLLMAAIGAFFNGADYEACNTETQIAGLSADRLSREQGLEIA